jgi:hypothetical protein
MLGTPILTTSLDNLLNNRTKAFIVHQLIAIIPNIDALNSAHYHYPANHHQD